MGFWDRSNAEVPNPELTGKETVTTPAEKSPAELIAEALSPFAQQFTAISERLNTIEESTRKPAPVQPSVATETPSVFDNEDAAFMRRLTPLAMRQLELEARLVINDIKGEFITAGFGDLWKKYEKEISSQLENSPVVDGQGNPLRGNPEYVRNVADMVLGRAARQNGVKFDGAKQTFFLESAGGNTDTADPAATLGLSEAQVKVFKRMGIDPAAAKKTVEKLHFVN